jgi:CHASE2 domain-containing sensor protein
LCTSFFKHFEDAIVLIGPEEKTFQDLAPTPFDQSSVPKVSVHGNLIKTLTNQKYLHRLSIRADHLATFCVCLVMAFLAVYQGKRASIVQATGIVLLISLCIVGI